jgi:hypothetical protein
VKLAQELFVRGQTDSLNVLDASARSSPRRCARAERYHVAQNLVSLYKAWAAGGKRSRPSECATSAARSASLQRHESLERRRIRRSIEDTADDERLLASMFGLRDSNSSSTAAALLTKISTRRR